MKQLTKILLINWHMFSCSEINVRNNILITGHNGAGKSTLLDAVQYVLTGGKTKFNLAANEDGARKLEGYVRGRLGTESQEYLRTKDVTTHIALEFFDEEEQKHFVLGAVIDLPEGGKPRENFYLAKRITADKDLYIRMTGEILTKGQFERNLKRLKIHFDFSSTKEEARRLVISTFSVNPKYTELVRRALAFKPIGNLNEFMYRFLLPEERINIDSLRQNVLEYRRFEGTLKEQRERLAILEKINDGIYRHGELLAEQAVNTYILELIRIEKNTALKETLREQMKEKERERTVHETSKERLKTKLNSLLNQIAGIQAQMNALDANGRIASLQERERGLKERFGENEKWAEETARLLKKDIGILNDLSVSHSLT
ncbi:MAG: AAA family ATPase, partial [Solobacterium sp.]|nr:AAA family ATPase [Solobacterium sp.]